MSPSPLPSPRTAGAAEPVLRRPAADRGAGLAKAGYDHEPVNLSTSWGDAALRLPAIHLVFSLAKRWLLGTHHGAVSTRHLPAYLDEYVFRFNRRTAKSISHGFARLIEQAVRTRPSTYRAIIATPA
jgi:hypothetical protein